MTEPFRAVPVETLNKVLCLIGSRDGEEGNAMTQSWVTQVAMEPVLLAIAVDASAVTNRLIRDGGASASTLGSGGHPDVREVLEARLV